MRSEFNPLHKLHLGESIRDALVRQALHELPPAEKFPGVGIYALYYLGDFPAYRLLAERNRGADCTAPIYVGEAVPEGARKGRIISTTKPSHKLYLRLQEHARTIEQAENLALQDFRVRYLIVDDIWIPLGETLMIETFRPVWNVVIDGFGIKTPGKGRANQYTSSWDTLHPGRNFVTELKLRPNPKSEAELTHEVEEYLTKLYGGSE